MGGRSNIDEALFASMWAEGRTCREIAAGIGIGQGSVGYHRRRLGLSARRRVMKRLDRSRLADLWQQHLPDRRIAEIMGVSPVTIGNHRRDLGLPARKAQPKASGAPVSPPKCPPRASVPAPCACPHPFWTPERDALVLETGGAYAAIVALVPVIGRSQQAILQRWHGLRAGWAA